MLTCVYLAIVVYAPALALSQVTGLNTDLSIGLTFLVCIFYTCLGGIKAVIWTNVFQALCMITSCLIVVYLVSGLLMEALKQYSISVMSPKGLSYSTLIHLFWYGIHFGLKLWGDTLLG